VPLAGKALVEWSLAAFGACLCVDSVVVAVPTGDHQLAGDRVRTVAGGATRAESVANALATVETALVAVHDAARPLLTPELLEDLVGRLDADSAAAGVIAATPVTDTIKRAAPPQNLPRGSFFAQEAKKEPQVVERTLDRGQLWAAQTPQVFRTDALRSAVAVEPEVRDAATDEAMLVERAGGKVLIHPTGPENLKVTTPLDLQLAELLLQARH
jgi:2-C-methyl-D-erythritol 4-phosphate cytidylyltransferase